MTGQYRAAHVAFAGVAALLIGVGTGLVISTAASGTMAVLGGAFAGLVSLVVLLEAQALVGGRAARHQQQEFSRYLRKVLREVIPEAVALSKREDGGVDDTRFLELMLASHAKAFRIDDTLESPFADLPAVWEADPAAGSRSAEQDELLSRLMTFPTPEEARPLLDRLDGLGPQTVYQFVVFAANARASLLTGLRPGLEGPHDAALTGHLIEAGLVRRVPVPAGTLGVPDGHARFELTPAGLRAARLFLPRGHRPQELAALDPSPGR